MPVRSYAAYRPKGMLKPFQYARKTLGVWDVRIHVTHCGICHSDVHLIDDDWAMSRYPLVPGHEVVGRVIEKGKRIRHLKLGARVGVGWQAGSCMKCEWCRKGFENLCRDSQATCVGNYGGYGEEIQVDGRFAFPIPARLSSEEAAPLLCGGITVFSPLDRYGVGRGSRVGIVGVGGLGHLAIQFASEMGAHVTAFSSSSGKEREVRSFGARRFVLTRKGKIPRSVESNFDFILVTTSVNVNWEKYMSLLKTRGVLCVVGAAPGTVGAPSFSFIGGEKSLAGSMIGGRAGIQKMLAFAAHHWVGAQTEVYRLSRVNEAVKRVRNNRVRYRAVLSV